MVYNYFYFTYNLFTFVKTFFMTKNLIFIICFFATINTFSQKINYPVNLISENLKENSNSVIRLSSIDIEIDDINSLKIKQTRVITVFNENGNSNIDAYENYDKSLSIQKMRATIYNAQGYEIKSIKSNDFLDRSAVNESSILTENRIRYLNYTPTEYPYTIFYESDTKTKNTAFIPAWNPLVNLEESIVLSTFSITYPDNLGFKFLEKNFEGINIIKEVSKNKIGYKIENQIARRYEEYSISNRKLIPYVVFGLSNFNLEGVEGKANTWEEFGTWMYDNLLSDTEELSDETKNKIKLLVANESDTVKKAKIIYEYVQNKTRYVSIQLGIGGWKPMLAKDVDRLGYGDCKALSNYTRVLLKNVGVESYFTIIYAGSQKFDIDSDFVSMQGNHAILAIPNHDKYTFLECTSQTKPFGYEGTFTDDRKALIVKPSKSEIFSTTNFKDELNVQFIQGFYEIDAFGKITADCKIESSGTKYDYTSDIENKSKKDIETHFKSKFYEINNVSILNFKFKKDKEKVQFTEEVSFVADNFATVTNNDIIFTVNAFNQSNNIPQRYRNRKNNFEISRGFFDQDEVEIKIPNDYKISELPEKIILETKFGIYNLEFSSNNNILKYKRSNLIKKGNYDKTDYESFRKFKEQISKYDNIKIILIKK